MPRPAILGLRAELRNGCWVLCDFNRDLCAPRLHASSNLGGSSLPNGDAYVVDGGGRRAARFPIERTRCPPDCSLLAKSGGDLVDHGIPPLFRSVDLLFGVDLDADIDIVVELGLCRARAEDRAMPSL